VANGCNQACKDSLTLIVGLLLDKTLIVPLGNTLKGSKQFDRCAGHRIPTFIQDLHHDVTFREAGIRSGFILRWAPPRESVWSCRCRLRCLGGGLRLVSGGGGLLGRC